MSTPILSKATILELHNCFLIGCQGDAEAKALSCQAVGITVQAPTVSNCKKSLSKLSALIARSFRLRPKLGGLMYHNNIVVVGTLKGPLLPFAHWASVKAAWCCQLRRVALCISPDYTDSSRSGKY